MKRVYRSRFGWEIFVPAALLLAAVFVLLLTKPVAWLGLAIVGLTFAWMIHLFLNTHYTIEENRVTIVCGFLYRKEINIQSINSIRESRSILSAPAPSLDRLEIRYGKHQRVLVSPRDKAGFVSALRTINGQIAATP